MNALDFLEDKKQGISAESFLEEEKPFISAVENPIVGLGETALGTASDIVQMGETAVKGLVGLARFPFTGAKGAVSEKPVLPTYEPKTSWGKAGMEVVRYPFKLLSDAGEYWGEAAREKIGGDTGAAVGANIYAAFNMIPFLFGRGRAKVLDRAVEKVQKGTEPLTKAENNALQGALNRVQREINKGKLPKAEPLVLDDTFSKYQEGIDRTLEGMKADEYLALPAGQGFTLSNRFAAEAKTAPRALPEARVEAPKQLPAGQGFQLQESQANMYFDQLRESVGRLDLTKAEKAKLKRNIETERKYQLNRIQQSQMDEAVGNVDQAFEDRFPKVPKELEGVTLTSFPGGLGEYWNKLKQTKFGKSFVEFWKPTANLPESEAYLGQRYKALGDVGRVESVVERVWNRTKDLPDNVKRDMFRFLDGEISLESLPRGNRSLATALRTTNNIIGQMLVKRGLLDERTFEANKSQYVRYVYLKHILGDDVPIRTGKGGRLDLSYLKQRKDLTAEQRKAIGLVENVSVAQPMGMSRSLSDIAKFDFMRKISENPNWVWTPSVVEFEGQRWGIGKLAEEVDIQRKVAKQAPDVPEVQARLRQLEGALNQAQNQTRNVPADFRQLPNSKAYGPLAGTFVRKEIYNDIKPVWSGFSEAGQVSKLVNAVLDIETKGMAAFKVGKVALNLPTVSRNVVSNIIQLNMSGIPLQEIPKWMIRAAESMKAKNKYFVEGKRNGLFKTNWAEGEISEVLKTVRQMEGSGLGVLEKVGQLAKYYGRIDDFFKLSKFIEMREAGFDVSKATIEAQKWGMDYSLVDPSIKLARRHVIPFGSYTYKIAPLVAESLSKNPLVLGKYVAIPYLMYEAAKANLKLTDEDWKKLKKELPLFIKKNESYAILPWKSPEGNAQWVNLEYFFPAQQYLALGRDVKQGNFGEIVGDVGVGNPFMDIYTVAKTMRGDAPPKDPFTGREIYNRLDPAADKALKTAEWLYNKWAPTMLTRTGAAGYTARAVTGQEDRYGRKVTPGQAAGRWFGVNIVAPSPKQSAIEMRSQMKELTGSLARIVADPTVSQERKKAAIQEFQKQLQEIRQ